MQKIEQKVPSNGDRCAKATTEGAPPTVTPALIKNAAAALAELMRQHESGGIHKVRPSTLSTLMSLQKLGEMSQSDDEVMDMESVGDDDDKSRYVQSSKSSRSTESGHLNPESRARLRALLESTGLGKLSTSDHQALSDPEVLRRLTDKVSSAMDEAASTLLRIKAEQQKTGPVGSSSSEVDIGQLTLDDGQLCPAELEQALQGDSLLLMACSAGYYQLAQVLLALKSDVEDRGTKGDRTPLMEAACGGYLDIVRLLLAHKANVNAQAPSGNTALHYAACSGYVDVASELIAAGGHVEEPNENGHTPLMEAATAGHVDVAALLLASGANINMHSTEFKESALTLACYKGHLDMVKFLLEQGADLEHKTDEMHTALMEASMDGHVDVARYLLDRGAQVNMPADSFESPLTLAACGGHTELASLLIERGANTEEVNDEGYTPLMEAVREGHEDVVTLLIHRAADVNAQTEETQETALTLACCGGFLEIAELLINAGANLELGCSTPLMEAAQEGHVDLVKYLIASGANVNAQTFTKGTALTYACENGHTEVAELLVHHGAELDHESEGGRTALMRAAKNGHQLTVEFLVSKGASVNKVTCSNDHTVLSLACTNGHLDVVKFLLRSGADVTHRLKDGSTMLMEAAKGGHFETMSLLLDWPSTSAGSHAATSTDVASHTKSQSSDGQSAASVDLVSPTDHGKASSDAGRELADGIGPPVKPTSDKPALPPLSRDVADTSDASWEAFVGKMACKGELLALDREEQIVVKQQMLDRLMLLERELQERTVAGKSSTAPDSPPITGDILDDSSAAATRNRFVVVDDRLRGDEELAIAILEKAVLGETVLDKVVLEQLKSYIRGGDQDVSGGGEAADQCPGVLDGIVRDVDSLSVSSSEEGDKFEDACGDVSSQADTVPQLDGLEKLAIAPQRQRTLPTSDMLPMIRTPAEGLDAAAAQAQAKLKDRPITKGQRRSAKSPTVLCPSAKPSKPTDQTGAIATANQVGGGGGVAANEQLVSDVEHNVMLQQQREQLQTQLVLQQQLHNELQQHLKLQQEHHQLQAQLMVKEASQSSTVSSQSATTGHSAAAAGGPSSTAMLDHHCCHEHPSNTHHRQHVVQQQLLQLQQQLQQAAGHSAIDSLQQAQQQAMHLARLHQKHSSMAAAAATSSSTTQSTQTAADTANVSSASARPNNAPLTGNAATLAAQKKAADLAACSGRSSRPSAGTQTHGAAAMPCPNCCMDAAKQMPAAAAAARPTASGKTSVPIEVDAQTDSNHDTALTLAAAGGHAKLVALLLTRGADVEHRDKKGLTPLILASAAGHVDVCEVLLQNKADIDNISDKNKDTALSLACSNGRLEVVELLLAKGANKEHRNISDYTPLSQAASGGYVNVIKVLLAHGAEINSRTGSKMGISPLMLAAMNGHTAAVKLLLDMGSDINAQIETNKNTALTLACFQGRYEVVSLLVDRKANIEHRAKTGLTPLMEAASGGYVEVGRVLLDKGADIAAAPVPVSRDTALTIAADKGHHRFVELLLTRGVAVDVKNKKGNTPLWLACNGGFVEVVQLLVAHGADVHSEDNRHVSCIMIAFRKAHVKVIKVLVRHVTQLPQDHDCLRYIATLTDKEMIKRCHQCMNMIVSAKEHQAAEANKNAAILLEELSLEREREETKKAAAARKRDRKKLKKKERADRDRETTDDNAAEDNAAGSLLMNGDVVGGDTDDRDNLSDEMSAAPVLTPVNDFHEPQPYHCDEQQQQPAKSRHSDLLADTMDVDKTSVEKVSDGPSEITSLGTDDVAVNSAAAAPSETSRRGRRNRRDRHKNSNKATLDSVAQLTLADPSAHFVSQPAVSRADSQSSGRNKSSVVTALSTFSGKETSKGSVSVLDAVKLTSLPVCPPPTSSITGIGDLDDFGSLSTVPTTVKVTTSKKVTDKPRITVIEQKSTAGSTKKPSGNSVKVGGKKGSRKDEEWEEVSRKSKRLLVPANTISRVIGRGGCNINAIRDISTAQVEIDRSRDATTERIITIKGSVEATKYAQSLIEALINDTDKKFEQQLPKMKPLQTSTASHGSHKQKSASGAKSSYANGATNSVPKDDQLSKLSTSKSGGTVSNFAIGAWQQVLSSSVKSSSAANAAVTVASAWCGDSAAVRASPEMRRMSYSDRAKAIIVSSASESSSMSRSPPADQMTLSSTATSAISGSSSGSVQLTPRCEPQPLPIVTATGFPGPAAVSRLSAAASSVMRDYSPFDNALSQIIADSVLTKRTDDFASVAAAGVITSSPPLSVSYSDDTVAMPPPISASDPHKAPGYKISAYSDPAKAPGHRVSKDTSASRAQTTASASTESGFRPSDYGRPNSTPNAAVSSSLAADISVPICEALGASLDRPASFYIRPNLAYPVPPPPGLMQPGQMQTGDVYLPPATQVHQFGASRNCGGAVTETSVLAAPLMATSLASASHPDNTVHHFSLPPSVTTSSAEHTVQSHGALDDRKTLGPIGTERAARRPANIAASIYPADVNMGAIGGGAGPLPDSWNMYTDGNWGNMPLFGTMSDPSAVMAAAGLPVDSSMMPGQHTAAAAVGMHVGYPATMNDINAMMMMSDVYHGNPSAVDQSAVKHMFHSQGSVGAAAMMLPPAAMFAADATASFNGMMPAASHLPTAQTGSSGMMMMSADDGGTAGWSSASADVSNYLSAKAAHLMWNHNWAPSANT